MVPDLTRCCASQPYYLCGEGAAVFHWSVNTTGAQLYPLPSLCRRPRAGKFICGPAINTSSREPRQQLVPRRRSCSLVDVEHRGDLWTLQLDAQCMDDVAPKQDFLSL
jgi:hypothetical protein